MAFLTRNLAKLNKNSRARLETLCYFYCYYYLDEDDVLSSLDVVVLELSLLLDDSLVELDDSFDSLVGSGPFE